MTYQNQPSLQYFTSVVKNVASNSLEIKKLVYIYLVHHAEAEPDTALLSINTIQKSLSDGNAQVRALALRVMSAIRVPVISQIVALGIKRGVGDMSPHVRKAAALAIPKCYRLDPNTLPQLLEHLSVLLGDRQHSVTGAAVAAFMQIAPQRLDIVHKHYRGLVRKIVDMDEWGQLATLQLMLVYSRKCFPRRTARVSKQQEAARKQKLSTDAFYGEKDNDGQPSLDEEAENGVEMVVLDPDLELLLKSIKPLLQSRNSAVIIAITRCFYYIGTDSHIDSTAGPLISILRSSVDIQSIALYYIVQICIARPKSFTQYTTHFLLRSTDTPTIYQLKLELLTLIFPHLKPSLKGLILNELEHFSTGHDRALVHESVRAIGRCAQSDSDNSERCMRLLLRQVGSPDGNLVAEALQVVRQLILRDPKTYRATVVRLAKSLDVASNAQARACIIWLVGEFAGVDLENNIAADVLRVLAKGFADEPEIAKLQIILLAARVYAHYLNSTRDDDHESKEHANEVNGAYTAIETTSQQVDYEKNAHDEHPVTKLWHYTMLLARYDTSYDLRDRARQYKALLAMPSSTELASLMLLVPKPIPQTPSPSASRRGYTLGSASLVLGNESGGLVSGDDRDSSGFSDSIAAGDIQGYERVPDWVPAGQEPDPHLREDESTAASAGYSGISSSSTSVSYADRQLGASAVIPAGDILENAVRSADSSTIGKVTGAKKATNGLKEKTLDDWLDEEDEDIVNDDERDRARSRGDDDNSEDDYTDETESETESDSEEEDGSTAEESDGESEIKEDDRLMR